MLDVFLPIITLTLQVLNIFLQFSDLKGMYYEKPIFLPRNKKKTSLHLL